MSGFGEARSGFASSRVLRQRASAVADGVAGYGAGSGCGVCPPRLSLVFGGYKDWLMDEFRTARALTALRERWRQRGILHEPGASEAECAAFEQHYGVTLPPDLRAYFTTLNGTVSGAYGMDDDDLLGFWHLDEVRTLSEQGVESGPEAARSFVIADHSIWVHAFAVQLTPIPGAPTPVVADIGQPLTRVAESFTEFVEEYLARNLDVLYPDPLSASPAAEPGVAADTGPG